VTDDQLHLDATEVAGMPPIPPLSDPVTTARRKHGAAGAVLAAGMFGVDIALGRKPKEEIPVVVTASGDPTDIDRDGMSFAIDDATQVVAPPLPPTVMSLAKPAKPRRKRG
jgi:hypothetical protein